MSAATAPEQLSLPVFRVPEVRQDCSFKLAVLYRETCLLDNGIGCFARNKYLATKFLKCHPSSVRDYYSLLEECGLVARQIEHGTRRIARPLVPLQDLFTLWPELAFACATCKRLGNALRAAAREALKKVKGAMARYSSRPKAEALKATPSPPPQGGSEGSFSQELRANSAPLSCIQRGREDEKTTTDSVPKVTLKPTAPKEPEALPEEVSVAVSLLKSVFSESEALVLAREATKKNRTIDQLKGYLAGLKAQMGNIRIPGAWFRTAIKDNYAPPADAPIHASDRGERPQRTTTTPPEDLAKMRAAEQAKQDREAAFEAAWKALDDTARTSRLEAALKRERAKGGSSLATTKRGIESACVVADARSEFRAEWMASQATSSPQLTAPQGETFDT